MFERAYSCYIHMFNTHKPYEDCFLYKVLLHFRFNSHSFRHYTGYDGDTTQNILKIWWNISDVQILMMAFYFNLVFSSSSSCLSFSIFRYSILLVVVLKAVVCVSYLVLCGLILTGSEKMNELFALAYRSFQCQ